MKLSIFRKASTLVLILEVAMGQVGCAPPGPLGPRIDRAMTAAVCAMAGVSAKIGVRMKFRSLRAVEICPATRPYPRRCILLPHQAIYQVCVENPSAVPSKFTVLLRDCGCGLLGECEHLSNSSEADHGLNIMTF